MSSRILYTKPSITELEVAYVTDAARNGWGAHCYDYITRLEAGFAQHLQVRHAIATSSCTGALHMGLSALGIGPGDEVIVPEISWIASASPIQYVGATPVFVDVLPSTWCIDPRAVEAAITPRTKAIIAVHLYGNMCDMDALLAISRQHGIALIEDAAEALGSSWRGQPAGSLGTFGTFSFHGTKTMTTGEGGMFVTQDTALFDKMVTLSNHGRNPASTKQFWPEELGFKYKMGNLQAALGCAQVERLPDLIAHKRAIFKRYEQALATLPGVHMNPEPEGTRNGYWMPTLVFDEATGVTRELLQEAFAEADIDARVFFWPLSGLPMFEACPANTVAWSLPGRAINLPSYHDMSEADQQRVIDIVRRVHQLAAQSTTTCRDEVCA
jgi:perosamine synthetase